MWVIYYYYVRNIKLCALLRYIINVKCRYLNITILLVSYLNYLNIASKNLQWVVGYFADENKYSVIPYSWLVTCGNLCISKWPKSGNINSLIQTSCEPGIDWPTYPVKIVSEYFSKYI